MKHKKLAYGSRSEWRHTNDSGVVFVSLMKSREILLERSYDECFGHVSMKIEGQVIKLPQQNYRLNCFSFGAFECDFAFFRAHELLICKLCRVINPVLGIPQCSRMFQMAFGCEISIIGSWISNGCPLGTSACNHRSAYYFTDSST